MGGPRSRGVVLPADVHEGCQGPLHGRARPPEIVNDHNLCVAQVRSIQNFHMDGNGWIDIGYSMVACPHKRVFVGRGPDRLPAANGSGLNSDHYAVLGLVGNAGFVKPNDDLLHAVLDAIEHLRKEGGAGTEIKGTATAFSTDCPGAALYAWVQRGAPRPGAGRQPRQSAGRADPGVAGAVVHLSAGHDR